MTDETRLTKVVAVRFSAAYHERVRQAADRAGLRPGVLVRQLVEDGQVVIRRVPEANMSAVGELSRIGGNLNQLLRLVQQGAVRVAEKELVEVIDELRAVRRELLGMDAPTLRGNVPNQKRWKSLPLAASREPGDQGGE